MLRVQFWRIENVVAMKVLEQGEEIERGVGTVHCDDNGISIISSGVPALERGYNEIYIRGTQREFDNSVDCENFNDSERAKEFIAKAVKAIHEYNIETGETKEETTDIETVIAE